MFRVIEMGGRVQMPGTVMLARRLTEITADHRAGTPRSLMDLPARTWLQQIPLAVHRRRGKLPAPSSVMQMRQVLLRFLWLLDLAYDTRPWWQRQSWHPVEDPRIPLREHEVTRARAAETGIRAELDRTRADASQLVTQALADAARERGDLRAWAEQQAERLRTELQQVRENAARLVGHMRDSAAARIAALEEATARLQAERDQLATDLRAVRRSSRTSVRARREDRSPGSRGSRATKRAQMIELAGQRRDLASVPLAEVSQLASSVAAEIGYSPGTARRELVRYVRGLLAAAAESQGTPDKEEETIDD